MVSCLIIGPFFFENEQGEAVTVNGDRYRTMLNEFLLTKIEEEDLVSTEPILKEGLYKKRDFKKVVGGPFRRRRTKLERGGLSDRQFGFR